MTSSRQKQTKLLFAGVLICFVFVFGVFLLSNRSAQAATGINQRLNFQGRLFNAAGAVIPDGDYNVEFKITQDGDGCNPTSGTFPCSGTVVWTETRTSTNKMTVKNGYFSVELGSVTALPTNIWNQDTLWLSINMGGTGSPSWDGEMKPLKRLTATPYAFNASLLSGLGASSFLQLAQGAQTDSSTTNPSIFVNKTNASGTPNILQLQKSGTDVFVVDNNGLATAAGGLTISTTKNLTVNGEAFTDLTGTGLSLSSGALGINQAASLTWTTNQTFNGGLVASGTVSINTTGTGSTTIGNSSGGTITIGANSGSNLVLNDADWSVTGAGAAAFASVNAGSGLVQTTGSVYGNTIDRSTAGLLSIGTGNATSITLGGASTVSTAAGGLTVITGKNLTVNGEAFTDLTGNGITLSGGALTARVAASADALSSTTSSGSGLEVLSTGIALLQGCSNNQVLQWNEATDVWGCANMSGGGGTLATSYAAGSSQSDSTIVLDSTRLGVRIQDAASPVSGNLFSVQNTGGTANYLGVTASAVTFQDSSGNNALVFDSTTSVLKVYENVASPSNYAQLYYASGEAVFAASSGTTRVGAGSGNITMSLTGNADVLTFSKASTPSSSYTSTDFKITRNLTGGANALQGSVLKIEDLSTFSGGSSSPDVVLINQNNSSATGNLVNAQQAGSSKFSVSTAGTVTIASGQSYTGAGAVTLSAAASNALTLTGNAASTWSTTAGALTIQGAGGVAITTTSGNVTIGTSDTTGTLFVLDDKTGSGDPTGANGGMYYNSNASRYRCYQNGAWKNCDDPWTTARVTGSNVTTTGQTLVDATGLSVALKANTVYEFEAVLMTQSSSTAGNQYAVNYSAAGASIEAQISGTLAAATSRSDRISALNTATVAYNVVAAVGAMRIQGIVTTGANPGNLVIRHLKVTSGTSTIFINSYLKAREL